jgi:ABC-2 type transport system ATP-binding protein
VTKRFGSFTAVDNFSLSLPVGEVLGFLGPNGAGKTTTIRMIMSITFPDEGVISVLGHPKASEVKDRIGYLPEERGLYRKMTVRETLVYFGRLKGLHGAPLKRRIDEALEQVGLQDWARKKVEALSKGMSQKLQFVSAILQEPELVILDEPFSGLDPLNTDMLERMIADLRRRGTTVIFSTHQMNQAERMCDRIVLINRGRKIIDGTIHDVRSQFALRVIDLDGEGDLEAVAALPGVTESHVAGGHARLHLDETTEPTALLEQIIPLVKVSRFEVQRPNLQEIFVRLVKSQDGQVPEAFIQAMEVPA